MKIPTLRKKNAFAILFLVTVFEIRTANKVTHLTFRPGAGRATTFKVNATRPAEITPPRGVETPAEVAPGSAGIKTPPKVAR